MSALADSEAAPNSNPADFGVLLTVAYDGAPFCGFARQTEDRTVAGELDGAVRAIDPKASLVRGVSRTDAGVHAHGQRVAFDTVLDIPAKAWVLSIMKELPKELVVTRAARVPAGFEPRRHALRKTYRYTLYESPLRDPFLKGRAWRVPQRLNHSLMREAALTLLGEHDFAAFRAAGDPRLETVRKIFRIEVRNDARDERSLDVIVEGDRFMYKMVRIIVGSLVDIGRARLDPSALVQALASKERRMLGVTAPAEGLYLESVVLDDEGTDPWPTESFARLT